MVDAVSAVVAQNFAQRVSPQRGEAAAPASSVGASATAISSHIRIDNLQNVVILEYVSSETGEVVQRYPTQSQIDAFRHAEKLRAATAAEAKSAAPSPASAEEGHSPVPATPAPAPTPAAPSSEGSTSVLA